jgi:hypothetical protein
MPKRNVREQVRRLEARRERCRREISRINLALARLELEGGLWSGREAGMPLVFRSNHGTLAKAPEGGLGVERSRGG